ncbi:D-alanyl-D-alanine carboxypeptidase/D-alanyl-D-alanine endopeptidase [Mucisphaera sp.]|uniref:D-alanyl-D-alanine carboxypeptidase/D-alanyl-D-alanine endopeptidase n=1 Tax=Mucisphaera sp. TaxID=2913024 RepID=UPI003D10B58B
MKRLSLLVLGLLLFVGGCSTDGLEPRPTAAMDRPVVELTYEEALKERLDEVLHGLEGHGAIVSARVLDAETGEELYSTGNVDLALKPASNMKLISSAIALETFGADHVFRTYLAKDGDDLYVVGTGDPAVGDPVIAEREGEAVTAVFDRWVAALKEAGVERIEGDLVVDGSAFEPHITHSSWWPEDLLYAYGAPVSGLNFNDNCVDITASATSAGLPVKVTLVPAVRGVEVVNRMTTDDGEEPRERPVVYKVSGSDTYVLSGELKEASMTAGLPVSDPARFFGDALLTHLEGAGLEVAGSVRVGVWEDAANIASDERVVAVHETAMQDVLDRTNKPSMNLYADALAKSAGLARQRAQGRPYPGSWLSGRRAVEAWFEEIGVESLGLVMADGSGLSHNNRVTARMISDLLLHMHRHEDAEAYKASLTVGGVDGTLRRRLTDIPGAVRAKTGTITGASALSGYVVTAEGRELVFSILFNRNQTSRAARALQDDAVRVLYYGVDWRPE